MNSTLDELPRQFTFDGNELTIKVKSAPKPILAVFFIVSFFLLLGPVLVIIGSIVATGRAVYPNIFLWSVLVLIGYFSLRTFLWNAFGQDHLIIEPESISYQANFKYFKSTYKKYPRKDSITCMSENVGYIEDKNFRLVLQSNEWTIRGGAKIPETEMEVLLRELQQRLKA